jgi:predicted component of type VI protein secretion system
VWVRVLDQTNGVYLRITEPNLLHDGDQLLIGKQVLRYEQLEAYERDLAQAMQHGVMVFGSPNRTGWGRLRQLATTGGTRDVVHLSRPDITLGREEGDFRFPEDEFMSRRHAQLSFRDGKVTLLDLASSNGTYLRVRGEKELRSGDLLRIGDQLLRLEVTG